MSIDADKISDTLEIIVFLLDDKRLDLQAMEQLIGKIQHCIKFCPGGRRFLNRLLEMRRNMNETDVYTLTDGAIEDLTWYQKFFAHFNGVGVIRSQHVPTDVFVCGRLSHRWRGFLEE